MTTSLTCFLAELLKVRNDHEGSSIAEILIVDDNAQLTPENRMKNTISFATSTSASGASCHQNSRWCSQPSLVTSIMNQGSQSGSSKWNSCTGTYTNGDATRSQKNASWNKNATVLRIPDDVFFVEGDHPAETMSSKLKKSASIMAPGDVPLSNPLMFINSEKRSVHAPRLPQRSSSPGSLQSRVLEKRKLSDRHTRNSLRAALGVMAPKSSLVERRSSYNVTTTKKAYAQEPRTRRVRTTVTSVDKNKEHVLGNQQRQGTAQRI